MKATRSVIGGGALGAVYLIFFALVWILGVAEGLFVFVMFLLGCLFVGSVLGVLHAPGAWQRTGLGTPYRVANQSHPATVAAAVVIAAGLAIYIAYLVFW